MWNLLGSLCLHHIHQVKAFKILRFSYFLVFTCIFDVKSLITLDTSFAFTSHTHIHYDEVKRKVSHIFGHVKNSKWITFSSNLWHFGNSLFLKSNYTPLLNAYSHQIKPIYWTIARWNLMERKLWPLLKIQPFIFRTCSGFEHRLSRR